VKIAHILPHSVRFPLLAHNGRYDWVLQLARLQAKNGHDVTIYCHPDSELDNIMTCGIPHASGNKDSNNIGTLRMAVRHNHDIYHSHFDNLHYTLSEHELSQPVLFTQHWWPTKTTLALAKKNLHKNIWAVPPTRYMYEFDKESHVKSKGFIHHGIDLGKFTLKPVQQSHRLLFVGRISPEKNLEVALSIAEKTGLGLDIIGKITEKNKDYWRSLQHRIDGIHTRYLGTKTHDELASHYSAATALLFPSDIHEAFGLTAIEAQACGTPVIMRRGGSRAELLEEKVTGFLFDTEDELIDAVQQAATIDGADCVRFSKKFDIQTMANAYDSLYEQLRADYIS